MNRNFVLIEKTVGRIFDEIVAGYPDNEAAVYIDKNLRQTWKELGARVDALARGLMALGIQPGEKIAIWAGNVPNWIELLFASAKIGVVSVSINPSYRDKELEFILKDSESETLALIDAGCGFDFLAKMHDEKDGQAINPRLPRLKRLIYMGDKSVPGMSSIAELLELGKSISPDEYAARQRAVDPHGLANMQYTSGTTGVPKGVMLSHVNIVNDSYWNGATQNLGAGDRICITVPFFHCFGLVASILCAAHYGCALIILPTVNPALIMHVIEQERCTSLYGVPSLFLAIVKHRNFERTDFSSLRTGIVGASICPAPLAEQIVKKMHMSEVTNAYGQTETSPTMCMTAYDDTFERRVKTVGRGLPGVEVKILDVDTRLEVPRGQVGEICCRGFVVMLGYYKNPVETAATIDADGFLHSGDLGSMDEDSYITVTGRIKDMIIRGGENISPREVEELILTLPGVRDVQVVAAPSEKYGEEVSAFIIPMPDAQLTPQSLRAQCRKKIAGFKIPRHIHFMESYPVTTSGKVQKFKLREMAARLFAGTTQNDSE
ncbi:MAG: AMP-binding protein [Deltaproteobacteria bacterium]|jgi:fatty-acyl-CoA synthase|nr:AMP-binding protein [Deltaproteobacteria bacterium]